MDSYYPCFVLLNGFHFQINWIRIRIVGKLINLNLVNLQGISKIMSLKLILEKIQTWLNDYNHYKIYLNKK